jgi:hypothetical protein
MTAEKWRRTEKKRKDESFKLSKKRGGLVENKRGGAGVKM